MGLDEKSLKNTALEDCVLDYLKAFPARLRWLQAEACQNTIFKKKPLAKFGRKKNAAKTIFESPTNVSINESRIYRTKQISFTFETYFCNVKKNKQMSKGVCIRQNLLTFDKNYGVLKSDQPLSVINCCFRCHQHKIFLYAQTKKGLNSFYFKRIVLDDGIHSYSKNLKLFIFGKFT